MGYADAFRSGAEVQSQGNPFSGIIKRVDEARARKAADDKDLRDVKNLFIQLGMKHEYDKELKSQEAFQKDYEPAMEGEESLNFKGTPFESIAGQGKFKRKPQEQGVYLVDPSNPESGVKKVSTVPKGSKVIQEPKGLEDIAEEAEVRKLGEIKPNLDRANESVRQLKKLYKSGDISKSVQKGDIFGGLMERGKGVSQGLVAKAGGNPELQQYLKLRKSFASLLTKGAFLEAGVLTNPDIERALGALPTTGSTKEEEEIGWKVLEEVLTTAQKRYEQLKSGKKQQENDDDLSNMSNEELMAIINGR